MPGELVFVTGAAGFVGTHVVLEALQAGYRVRGSVRRQTQVEKLKQFFGPKSSAEFVIVPDITKPDAYDGVLDGVSFVCHVASPLPSQSTNWRKDYIDPAVSGTITMLRAAQKVSSIKKVVITASIADLTPWSGWPSPEEAVTEDHEYELNVDLNLDFETPFRAYHASKILAAKASHEFFAQEKPHFSVVSLHPTFIFGRNLLQESAKDISGSSAMLWFSLKGPDQHIQMSNTVHISDVAQAHIKSLRPDITGYQKFLLSDEPGFKDWQDVLDFVKHRYPDEEWGNAPTPAKMNINVNKAGKMLNMEWRSWEMQVIDTVGPQLELLRQG